MDNRPVWYCRPTQMAAIVSSIECGMPKRAWLGGLTKYAAVEEIFTWLENLPELDAIILSLDTLAYGGLIPSRRCPDSFEQIKKRIERLKNIILKKHARIYAFSSIMRI